MRTNYYSNYSRLLFLALLTAFWLPATAQNGCFTNGGELNTPSGSVYVGICVDDGTEVPVEITRDDFAGDRGQYFLTTPSGFIIDILSGNPPFDLSSYGAINLAIWSASYSGSLTGAGIGDNICATGSTSCFSLSNPIVINRREGSDCDVFNGCTADAGMLALVGETNTTTTRCIQDDVSDPVEVAITGSPSGENMTFLITDDQGNILAIPGNNGPFDLSGAGNGTCLIWYLSYEDDLTGLTVGANASDFDGCFALSNPITVERDLVSMGVFSLVSGFTSVTICAGDGIPDPFDVTLSDTAGTNIIYVITDDMGQVLALPAAPPFDLEGAGGGVCNVYALSTSISFGGIMAGDNIADLTGCFALSNPIVVTRNTGGECRDLGFTADLSGLNELPCPVTTTGSGTVTAELTGNTLTVSGSFSGLMSDFDPNVAGGAHLHTGMAGMGGGIAFRLDTELDTDLRGGSFLAENNSFELSNEQVEMLVARGIYVNIHTVDFGGGELRGQLIPAGADDYKVAYLLGVNEVPAIVTPAMGAVIAERTGNTLTVSGGFSGLTGTIATDIAGGAHIHLGVAGRNGPVLIPLTLSINDDMTGATFAAADNTYQLTDEQVDAMSGGMLYVNIHSSTVRSGELRGQLLDGSVTQFYSNPSGHQARPMAVNTPGNGRLMMSLDADNNLSVTGSANDLMGTVAVDIAMGSHIHLGLAGSNGQVVFPLNITLDDNNLGGVYLGGNNTFALTEDQVTAFYERRYYVNIHTNAERSGEIRGQVMNLAKGYFGSNLAGINANPDAVKTTGGGFMMYEACGTNFTATGSFTDLTSDFDAAVAGGSHVHLGDAASTGGISLRLTADVADDLRSGQYLAADNMFEIDSAFTSQLTMGNYYFNLHTTGNPSGELRGQLLRDDNAFPTAPQIITPEDNAEVTVFQGGSTLDDGAFAAAEDSDGDLLVYTIEVALLADEDFTEILACEKVGVDTLSNATLDAVYDTLIAFGALEGTRVPLRYRVVSSDGSVATPGPSRRITLLIGGCNIDGGTLALADGGTEFTICAGDGEDDFFNVVLTDTAGTDAFTYLVVSDAGEILGVPGNQPFNFEGAGGGACTLYAVSHDGSLSGATMGARFEDLGGCFALSNPVVVTRLTGDDCDDGVACDVEGGILSLESGITSFTICAGDGMADPFNVVLTDTTGTDAFTYLVVSDAGVILGVPANQPFDFDGAGGGACTLYAVSHDGSLSGAVMGAQFADLGGCFALSNPMVVTRLTGDDCNDVCFVEGGFLELANGGTEFNICAGDGIADPFNVVLTDTVGTNAFTYIVVSDEGEILGVPGDQPFDFEGAGGGACTLYAVSHDGSLSGAVMGAQFDDLDGCFALSNPVVVTRLTGDDCSDGAECNVRRGILSLENGITAFTICAGDGVADPFNVVLTDTTSIDAFTYLVVSDAGVILGVPANQPFDFDGAGGGACTLYAVSHDGSLSGAVMGARFDDLGGCFALSNPVVVTRLTGDDCNNACSVEGGSLELADGGTEFTICAGDGIADPFNVVLTDTVGTNAFTYIVVSDEGEILGVPGDQPFDFEGAGGGACTLYAVSHDGSLSGAVMGAQFDDLDGCFALSNPVVVTRLTGDDCNDDAECNVRRGTLSLENGITAFTICAGDGVADPFNVVLTDTTSIDAFTYLVVSDAGVILGVPANQPFDFDGAGGGACTLYAVSHDGSLSGAVMGARFDDLGGCFALSNPVVVTRLTGDDCNNACSVEGGSLELADGGTAFTICAGDGVADPFSVVLTDTAGTEAFTYLVVSDAGVILGTPANQPFDFDGAGGGACTLYAVSHDGSLSGARRGEQFADLGGCFALSNPVVVTRNVGNECDDCNVDGGFLLAAVGDGGGETEFTICAGDGVPDPFNVLLNDTVGVEFTYLVVSDQGEILGVPANQPFDFDGAGGGACTLYAVSHDGSLTGAVMGGLFSDLTGCFDLSNPVVVTRLTGDDCNNACSVEGGSLELADGGTEFTICAGDGEDDFFSVVLTDTVGTDSFTYLVVSDAGVILGVPADQPFNFEGAGGGACTLYAVSHDGSLSGAQVDEMFEDLGGCFDLSNAVVVTRQTGNDCEGGRLTINEVNESGMVEIINFGDEAINLSQLFLASNGMFVSFSELTMSCGDLMLAPGKVMVVDASAMVDFNGDELAITSSSGYNLPGQIINYVAWGNSLREGQELAMQANLWSGDTEIPAPTLEGASLQRVPNEPAMTYGYAAPTNCAVNTLVLGTIQPAADEVKVFPNPFTDRITLEVSGLRGNNTLLTVMDINGRVVMNRQLARTASRTELNTAGLAAGTYLIRLTNDAGSSTARIIRR